MARTPPAAELRHAAALLNADDALGRLLLRAEGVASSYIEGVRAPVLDVVLAEKDMTRLGSGSASRVAANLRAARDAAAWSVVELLARHLVLTSEVVGT